MDDQEAEEMVNKIPMRYAYFRKNEDCPLPDSVIEERIPTSVREAGTFEELYDALCVFKMDLESNTAIDKVSVTMDVPDVPTGNDEEVMVDLVIQAKQGFRSNFIVETPKDGKDLTLGIGEAYFNITNQLDYIVSQYKYDLIRGNYLFQTAYSHPKGFLGLPTSLAYHNSYQSKLKESGVNIVSDSLIWEVASRDKRVFMNLQCSWRNVTPFGDIDEEGTLKTHCSSSMLSECRPSLRTGFTIGCRDDTRDNPQQPTNGFCGQSSITYNGFVGDVHSIKSDNRIEFHIPIIPEIADEPGLIFHASGVLGFIKNFGNRTTRYVDRYFMSQSLVHGYTTNDFGPKSSSEEGGRKEGDILGANGLSFISMALSLPVVISREYTLDMRGKLFYESGGIWNWSQGLKEIRNSHKSSWGIAISLPLMDSSIFEVYYLFKQKRFGFSFFINFPVCV